jgi:translation initiation factor 1 (eIF-1/SUI1)
MIEIWVETIGKKKQTMISGLDTAEIKEHLSKIKHKVGCNGTRKFSEVSKSDVMMLQGDHIRFMNNYLTNTLNKLNVVIHGI